MNASTAATLLAGDRRMFFEGIRAERHLLAAGLLATSLINHWRTRHPSSLIRIRERYDLDIFRCFFERIVE